MHYERLAASDGCVIAFQSSLNVVTKRKIEEPKEIERDYPHCVLLIHGFSGSSQYFTRNFATLQEKYWVVAPDLRGHGESGRTRGGYHVGRLAADLRELTVRLRIVSPNSLIFPVGCSIGAAILWTYVELFGSDDFAGFVFADQAPLQDRSKFGNWDESRSHKGCYDEATLLRAQHAWINQTQSAHLSLVQECLGYRYLPEPKDIVKEGTEQAVKDEEFFNSISAKCEPTWLAQLLADHTRYDHREAIEQISIPTLVVAGRRTGCFPIDGILETVKIVNLSHPGLAKSMIFDSGHWMFYEEPERFNNELVMFIEACMRR
jgi:pimeloyl-ACP methyl ester carboxylesterase